MSYIEQWANSLRSLPSRDVPRVLRIEGLRDAHLGPRMEYARISLEIEPASTFHVDSSAVRENPEISHFVDAAIFGLLDVLIVAEPLPVRNIRVIVKSIDTDPVSSSVMAFRHAGREAGRKILEAL